MRAYRAILRHPGVVTLALAALVSRMTSPVLSLGLLLVAQERYGSYALGGGMVGGYTVAFALAAPITSRLVDRVGPKLVLTACMGANTVGYAGVLTALDREVSGGLLLATAAFLGLTLPPLGAVTRSAWPALVPADQLQQAYAFDTVLSEVAQIGAPLLVALLMVGTPAALVVAAAGGSTMFSVVLILCRAVGRRAATAAPPTVRAPGGLATRAPLAILAVGWAGAAATGSLIVAVAAAAGNGTWTGLLLAALGVGAVLAALTFGSRSWGGRRSRQLAGLHLAAAALLWAAGAAPSLAVLVVALLVLGLIGGPRDTLTQLMLNAAAPFGRNTETFGWFSTLTWVGYGTGTALAGALADSAFSVAAVSSVLAAALALTVPPRATAEVE